MNKFSSSSSSSNVSTATAASLNMNFYDNSKSATTAGCLASVLRGFFCSRSLPTYPSDDHQLEQKAFPAEKIEAAPAATQTHGIVARLMGLDSMPIITTSQKPPKSISRSLSANCSSESDPSVKGRHRHRRVKNASSSSLREVPIAYFELENQEFLLLSFDRKRTNHSKEPKLETGAGGRKQQRRERVKDAKKKRSEVVVRSKQQYKGAHTRFLLNAEENLSRSICASQKSIQIADISARFIASSRILRPTKSNSHEKPNSHDRVETVEAQSSSENSSPVSVLDCGEFLTDPEAHTSEEEPKPRDLNSRRKLSESLDDCGARSSNQSGTATDEREALEEAKRAKQSKNYLNAGSEICSLAARDAIRSNWVYDKPREIEDLEEIPADFGMRTLNELLEELVEELVIQF